MAEITIRISDRLLKVVGILLVGTFVVWVNFHLWSSGFYQPKYRLKTYIAEAAGLPVGTPVRLDGFDVGTVQAINLAEKSASPERRIELVLRVEKRHQDKIRRDSSAGLITEGLFGQRYVEINRGFSGVPLSEGEEIPALPSGQIIKDDFVNSVGKFADCLKEAESPGAGKVRLPNAASPKGPR
jgi:phospholipid/cholesterol/gamma-HCH transport system substrate-binding protein